MKKKERWSRSRHTIGIDGDLLEKASEVARQEMSTLMEMRAKGMLKDLKTKKERERKEE